MTYQDPNDPNIVRPIEPAYVETVETVVVRESNSGWWIAGILGGLVLIAVMWILFAGRDPDQTDAQLAQAQADVAAAQANADAAMLQGQVAGAQASVDIARADAARSQADAIRAASEARAAEARAVRPSTVVIEREVSPPPPDLTIVSPNSPQN